MTDHIAADQSGVDERAKFEAWFADSYMDEPIWDESRNCFKDFSTHMAFKGWQAALASTQPVEQKPVGYLIRYTNGDPDCAYPWVYSNAPVKRDDVECKEIYTHPSPAPAVAGEAIRNQAFDQMFANSNAAIQNLTIKGEKS